MTETYDPPAAATWSLLLVWQDKINPWLRRVGLVGDVLEGFALHAGQRIAVTFWKRGRTLHRTGQIVGFDAQELRLDIVLPVASDPAAEFWIGSAELGDAVTVKLLAG